MTSDRAALRVLLVEDSADDADLLIRELKRSRYDVTWLRVESGPAMRAALESQTWDLVVADYHVPDFGAPAALDVLQKMALDIPLIIVSGSIGEEVAVESMRAGAHDFLLKGSLKRLLPALERELGQADRRRAQHKAEEQNRLLAAIVQSFDDAVIATDLAGAIVAWNRGAEKMYGYEAAQVTGRPVSILEPGDRRGEVDALLENLRSGAGLQRYETSRVRRDGTAIEVAVSLFPIPGPSGEISGVASVARDITERKRTEEALRGSEERYRMLFESNPQPMWAFDDETLAFLAVNEAASRHYGYTHEEFLGMTIKDIRPPDDVPLLLDRIQGEAKELLDSGLWRHQKKDGTIIQVEIRSHPLVFGGRDAQMILAMDVTERRQLEEQMRQSHKMEAVGQLAGGVAHDFNNLLTAILGYADLLSTELDSRGISLEEIGEIQKAGERAAGLTRQLLAFSRRQVLSPVLLDLNDVVADLEKMLRRLIGEDIALASALDQHLWDVQADRGQIEQVVVNMIVNSRDAMPGGGKITIETRNCDIDDSYVRTHADSIAGQYVCLSVSDTGEGMDAATRSRIFEPFFTTKESGKGTGLGLSTVYGIVKQSGGAIEVYSERGQGTAFKVYLPRARGERVAAAHPPERPLGGSETILLVEDEDSVRRLARRVLESAGYAVLEAASAEEAIEIAALQPRAVDLLLTDSVMTGMSGPDLARRFRSERPDLKVLFISGYTDDAIVRHGLLGKTEAFLQKPFTPAALARKVRDLLDLPAGRAS